MTPVAPRIGNDVSYVRTIQQSSHFSWQVQYLVKFKCHFSWQGALLGEVQVSLFVAGAVLGDVQVSLFVAGAVCGEGLNVRLAAKRCIFQ